MILTVIGYWLSNIIGILMMQWGTFDLFFEDRESSFKRDVLLGLAGATIYTVVVVVLLYFNVIDTPDFLAI
jgi:L-ribulose-5-phosphate 3-epimerase UlaE